jgi:hypothetical protein
VRLLEGRFDLGEHRIVHVDACRLSHVMTMRGRADDREDFSRLDLALVHGLSNSTARLRVEKPISTEVMHSPDHQSSIGLDVARIRDGRRYPRPTAIPRAF